VCCEERNVKCIVTDGKVVFVCPCIQTFQIQNLLDVGGRNFVMGRPHQKL